MQVTSCFLLATLSILHRRAVGSPIFERQATNLVAVPINATFDEGNLNLLDNIVNIITHPPYGTRSGLSYDAFTVASPQDLIIGTHANSLPNVLVFDVLSSIREGKTMIRAPGPPNAAAFSMESFYFACILAATISPLIVPSISCDLSVTGFDSDDNVVASATRKFKALYLNPLTNTVQLSTPMQKYPLPANFSQQLNRVVFEATPIIPVLSVAFVDTMEQTLYFQQV